MQGARNVVYICDHLVDRACLAEKPADACVNELIDRYMAGSTEKHTRGLHGPLLAAIIVPVVVAGKLFACACLDMKHTSTSTCTLQHPQLCPYTTDEAWRHA